MEKGTKTKCQDTCYWTLPAGTLSSSPVPFLTLSPPPPSLLSVVFVDVSLELLILTRLTVWAKTVFISTFLAGKTTVLLLERPQNVPDVNFSVSLHCSTHCYSSKFLPISDFLWQLKQYSEENWSVQCSSCINQPPWQRRSQCKLTHRGHAKCQQNSGGHWGNNVLITNRQECTSWLLISLWKGNLGFTNANGTFDIDFTGLGDLQHIF